MGTWMWQNRRVLSKERSLKAGWTLLAPKPTNRDSQGYFFLVFSDSLKETCGLCESTVVFQEIKGSQEEDLV